MTVYIVHHTVKTHSVKGGVWGSNRDANPVSAIGSPLRPIALIIIDREVWCIVASRDSLR